MKRTQEAEQAAKKQIIGQAQLPSGEWVDIVGLILSENAPLQLLYTNIEFNKLLPEHRQYVIELLASNSGATTLDEATKTINALAQTNKELNQLINGPVFCLKIIKHLAHKFECSDEKAATTLQTKAAKERSELQSQFLGKLGYVALNLNLPINDDSKIQFIKNLDSFWEKVDLDYTYGVPDDIPTQDLSFCYGITPLMLAIIAKSLPLAKILLEKGAHINAINPCGRTALMIAVSDTNVEAVKFLLNNPHINIDHQEFEFGYTALCIACMQYESDTEEIKNAKKEIVEILLAAGANPEIGDPLKIAEKYGAEESYLLIEYALKHPSK